MGVKRNVEGWEAVRAHDRKRGKVRWDTLNKPDSVAGDEWQVQQHIHHL